MIGDRAGLAFAGGGLDRAAEARGDADWQAGAAMVPVWRGKVCLDADGALVRLGAGHPALADTGEAGPVLLGRDAAGQAVAACDISAWAPPNLPETELFFDPSEQVHPAIPGAGFVELRGAMMRLSPLDAELAATVRDFYAYLGQVVTRHQLAPEEISSFRNLLVEYIQMVVEDVLRHGFLLASLSRPLSRPL